MTFVPTVGNIYSSLDIKQEKLQNDPKMIFIALVAVGSAYRLKEDLLPGQEYSCSSCHGTKYDYRCWSRNGFDLSVYFDG